MKGFIVLSIIVVGSIGSVLMGIHESKKIDNEIALLDLQLKEDKIRMEKYMIHLRGQANMFSEEA